MKNLSVKKLTMAGVMAALVFVMTYLPKVPVPVTGGYVHLGDGAIFLATLLLGPLGIPAAAIGSGLSDLLGGYMVYVLPTVVIKSLVAFIAWKVYKPDSQRLVATVTDPKGKTVWKIWQDGSWLRAVIAFVLAEAVMVLGYFAFEAVVYSPVSAWAAVGMNCIQGVAGVALGLVCHALYPRMKQLVK